MGQTRLEAVTTELASVNERARWLSAERRRLELESLSTTRSGNPVIPGRYRPACGDAEVAGCGGDCGRTAVVTNRSGGVRYACPVRRRRNELRHRTYARERAEKESGGVRHRRVRV